MEQKSFSFYHFNKETEASNYKKTDDPILFFMYEDSAYCSEAPRFHSHSYTEIFYIVEGEGTMLYEYQKIPFVANDIFIVPKNIKHSEIVKTPTIKYMVIAVDNNYPFFETKKQITDLQLKYSFETQDNDVFRLYKNIKKELSNRLPFMEHYVNSMINQVFIELLRVFPYNDEKTSATVNIQVVHDYIIEHCQENLTLKELANLIYTSPNTMGKIFKQVYGITPIQFLVVARIEKAKKLLKNTYETIAHIAISCGFSSPAYFSYVFINQTGQSPKDYRNENYFSHEQIEEKRKKEDKKKIKKNR